MWDTAATAVDLVVGDEASLAAEETGTLAVTAVARAMTVEKVEAHAAAAVWAVSVAATAAATATEAWTAGAAWEAVRVAASSIGTLLQCTDCLPSAVH